MLDKMSLLGENLDPSWRSLSYLGEEDLRFLAEMFERFPQVKETFEGYVGLPALERIPKAMNDLQGRPRTGWLKFGVVAGGRDILSTHAGEYSGSRYLILEELLSDAESVLEHATEASELALALYPQDRGRVFLHEMLKFHDCGEAIMTDFTPDDPIERWEKQKLEGIGQDFLTRSRLDGDLLALHIYSVMRVFERQASSFEEVAEPVRAAIQKERTLGHVLPHQERFVSFLENLYRKGQNLDVDLLATQGKDCDLLQMELRARRMEEEGHSSLSKADAKAKYDVFYAYVKKGLKTSEGKSFLQCFRELSSPSSNPLSFVDAYNTALYLTHMPAPVRNGLLHVRSEMFAPENG